MTWSACVFTVYSGPIVNFNIPILSALSQLMWNYKSENCYIYFWDFIIHFFQIMWTKYNSICSTGLGCFFLLFFFLERQLKLTFLSQKKNIYISAQRNVTHSRLKDNIKIVWLYIFCIQIQNYLADDRTILRRQERIVCKSGTRMARNDDYNLCIL